MRQNVSDARNESVKIAKTALGLRRFGQQLRHLNHYMYAYGWSKRFFAGHRQWFVANNVGSMVTGRSPSTAY